MYLYELENISKKYNKQTAFKAKELKLEANKLIAIVGNSGSGKSTLLKLLANITKPSEGKVIFQGEDISNYKPKQTDEFFRLKVDVIFQEYNLIENLTVYENLELLKSISSRVDDQQICKVLTELKIEHIRDKLVTDISGGEAQRTAIARSLLKPTDVILADEPTGALDIENTNIVIAKFREIAKGSKSIIFVTHDLKCAAVADTIYIIKDGQIVKQIEGGNEALIQKKLEQIFMQIGGVNDRTN